MAVIPSAPKVRWKPNQVRVGSDKATTPNYVWDWDYSGLLVSETHFRKRGRYGYVWSGGGPFYVHHESMTHKGGVKFPYRKNNVDFGTYTIHGATGFVVGVKPEPPKPLPWSTVRDDASASYATGYKRARPGNPVASVGQFLIELRDLPQAPLKGFLKKKYRRLPDGSLKVTHPFYGVPISEIPKRLVNRHQAFRNLGSEYLNVQFGWLPFVSDLQKMYYLWQTLDKRLAQLVRENGKNIRRKATVKDEETNEQTETEYSFPWALCIGSPGNIGPGRTVHRVVSRTKTKIWFSGSFRYYIPDIGSSAWTTRATLALFGALPTPELLWEVMPYSWLIDWFSNVGDVVSNASQNAVDNLTTSYSFIMKHTRTEITRSSTVWCDRSLVNRTQDSWPAMAATISSTHLVEKKVRVGGGNPFGLDVALTSLSGHQRGILAALGISRKKLL